MANRRLLELQPAGQCRTVATPLWERISRPCREEIQTRLRFRNQHATALACALCFEPITVVGFTNDNLGALACQPQLPDCPQQHVRSGPKTTTRSHFELPTIHPPRYHGQLDQETSAWTRGNAFFDQIRDVKEGRG